MAICHSFSKFSEFLCHGVTAANLDALEVRTVAEGSTIVMKVGTRCKMLVVWDGLGGDLCSDLLCLDLLVVTHSACACGLERQ